MLLLRKVLERNRTFAWESVIDNPSHGFYAALAKRKSDDGADNDAANAAERNAFEEHTVAKKCHRRHLFFQLLKVNHRFCFTPEAFEAIIFALFWPKDMYDEITKVYQNPPGFSDTFSVKNSRTLFL